LNYSGPFEAIPVPFSSRIPIAFIVPTNQKACNFTVLMDKKSLFRQEVYGNHGLCVKVNSTPHNVVIETRRPEIRESGWEEPDIEDVAQGCFTRDMRKLTRMG